MRKQIIFKTDSFPDFHHNLLSWLKQHDIYCYLNSNGLDTKYGSYDFLCAVGSKDEFVCPENNVIAAFKEYFYSKSDWLFGFFTYDLKNELENLTSNKHDGVHMPLIHFFNPELVFYQMDNLFHIAYFEEDYTPEDVGGLFKHICNINTDAEQQRKNVFNEVQARVSKEVYLEKMDKIKKYIQDGDIYEMNYCIEFYASSIKDVDVLELYSDFNQLSPAPFSCVYKLRDKVLISTSPERFLKKSGQKMLSQPIKGTIKRGESITEDEALKDMLAQSEKEKSENVMIVDLVRNDMSHFAHKSSVKVEELFGIYSYAQVHQMISTVSCELKEDCCIVDAIMKCFPPGSMTGAPKIRAMQIIEDLENTKRGLYSGSVGYFSPEKDFDFNVVIRSILVNNTEKYASFMAGGAITAQSVPEMEYEECLLKAKAMMKILNGETQ